MSARRRGPGRDQEESGEPPDRCEPRSRHRDTGNHKENSRWSKFHSGACFAMSQLGAIRSPWDVALFIKGGWTDARLRALRKVHDAKGAFDRLYHDAPDNDPWLAESSPARYQERKYDALISLLPKRHFGKVLDLGCGSGLLTTKLAGRADQVVGLDISSVALRRAAERRFDQSRIVWRQGDIQTGAGIDFNDRFDLIVVADTLYYLDDPITDQTLKRVAVRLSRLLAPRGIVLLADHYFFFPNQDTRLTCRIHDTFSWSPWFRRITTHRRAFFQVTLLESETAGMLPDPQLGPEIGPF